VFQNGQQKLAEAVAIQTEVSFITWYLNQPSFGEVDAELRGQGFIPHCLAQLGRRPIGDFEVGDDALPWVNQLTEADVVYVRDFTHPDLMTDEQLKHLALIAHRSSIWAVGVGQVWRAASWASCTREVRPSLV
jgi:hypothetical protein